LLTYDEPVLIKHGLLAFRIAMTQTFITSPLDFKHLPTQALYGDGEDGLGWVLSPKPFELSAVQHAALKRLGPVLQCFMQAIDDLYRLSSQSRQNGDDNKNGVPGWIAGLYEQGKPDSLLQFARMKRLKTHLPLILRPDLLLREDGTWTLCEIDAVPGGLGFTAALNRFYRLNGFLVLEGNDEMDNVPDSGVLAAERKNTLPVLFLQMLKNLAPDSAGEAPVIALVLSDEAADYRAEMSWLVNTIRQGEEGQAAYTNIVLLHPRELDLVRDRLVFTDAETGEEKPIDVLYRFFELFDLPNIPKIELIQYAIKKDLVVCTAPFKPHLEEKLSLALLHHPLLQSYWQKTLGKEDFDWFKSGVPESWVLDPTPIPPQAVIPGLSPAGEPVQDFRALKGLSQKERQLVLKPSGFSPLGWGSRGVTIGHDQPADVWAERLEEALQSFSKTPYILQNYRSASVLPASRVDRHSGEITEFQARVRLCPYYFVIGEEVKLAGALATACPANKKLIHGMKDAVLMPVAAPQK
jgi:hypothetical protein